jgi:hypothetical protein
MPAWSRTVLPASVTPPRLPEALKSIGGTGKVQTRTPLMVGFGWEEAYPPLLWTDHAVAKWLAEVDAYWHSGVPFTVQHLAYQTQRGVGGGAPLVNGASQTGSSINVDGAPNSVTFLRAGDFVRLGALAYAQQLTADAVTNGSGQVALSLKPPIVSGNSPADNAAVTYGSSFSFQCVLVSYDPGEAGPDQFITGLRLGFQETP